jgi:tripartite motif-containing protein 71
MNSVKKFDSEGNFVKQWGDSGKEDGKFNLTLGVAVDAQNNVFVTDFYNKRIQKFSGEGSYMAQWANEPSTSPAFMAIDGSGNIYVDQFPPHGDHYIEKFDWQGKLIAEWGIANDRFSGRIEDIAVDKDGNLYVADPILHRIQKLNSKGEVVATFGGEMSKEGKGAFDDPFGISVDMDGNIYVLDSNFLQKLDAKGKFIAQWSTLDGELEKASNVMVDKKGNIYVFAKTAVTGADGSSVKVFLLKKFAQS